MIKTGSPTPTAGGASARRPLRGRRGFTLIETLFSVAVIFLLIGLLIVGLRVASRVANKATEQHAVAAMIIGCEQFKMDFGFPPPLVEDNNPNPNGPNGVPDFKTGGDSREGPLFPLNGAPSKPVAFLSSTDQARYANEERFLRGREPGAEATPLKSDYRFSTYSLAYYLLGVLGKDSQGNPIDGVDGAGFLKPNADGTFRTTGGKKFQPLFDTSKGTKGVVAVDGPTGKFELRDRRGVPYRYYMWRHGRQKTQNVPSSLVTETTADLNVPSLLGDPTENSALRGAEYAIVGAGANSVFGDWWASDKGTESSTEIKAGLGVSAGMGDERAAAMAREDNVVEVGR